MAVIGVWPCELKDLLCLGPVPALSRIIRIYDERESNAGQGLCHIQFGFSVAMPSRFTCSIVTSTCTGRSGSWSSQVLSSAKTLSSIPAFARASRSLPHGSGARDCIPPVSRSSCAAQTCAEYSVTFSVLCAKRFSHIEWKDAAR